MMGIWDSMGVWDNNGDGNVDIRDAIDIDEFDSDTDESYYCDDEDDDDDD